MRTLDQVLLQLLWSSLSSEPLPVEVDTDEGGPEGFGPEVWLDHTVAIWPSEIEPPDHVSINNAESAFPVDEKQVGWYVARMIPEYNYPHAPDGMDYEEGTEHTLLEDALATAILLVVESRIAGALEAMADAALAEDLEALEEKS